VVAIEHRPRSPASNLDDPALDEARERVDMKPAVGEIKSQTDNALGRLENEVRFAWVPIWVRCWVRKTFSSLPR